MAYYPREGRSTHHIHLYLAGAFFVEEQEPSVAAPACAQTRNLYRELKAAGATRPEANPPQPRDYVCAAFYGGV